MFKSRKVDAYIITPIKGIEEDVQMLLDDATPVILFDGICQTLIPAMSEPIILMLHTSQFSVLSIRVKRILPWLPLI
ncbi:hypothetical protein [Pedobacter psychrodurus]|uniref:hypothetical protein n=1 Tax=Pedobacter psychrodurus TaxID=2530456 RepID=UPI001CECF5BE|nr:hypothetical protein [Pedobacter psychrodurus]